MGWGLIASAFRLGTPAASHVGRYPDGGASTLTPRRRGDLFRLSGRSVPPNWPATVPEAGPADPSPGPGESELTDGVLEPSAKSRAQPGWSNGRRLHALAGAQTLATAHCISGLGRKT